MKGLYCKLGEAKELKFIIQETTVAASIGDHQVKVQVKGCSLSPVDIKLCEELKLQKEHVPVGREIAGVVLQVGPKVTFFQPDDEVVGILPLDAEISGLCDIVLVDEYNLVQKPEKVSWFEAAGAIKDGLKAYTALHTLARMAVGHTLLVLDGASKPEKVSWFEAAGAIKDGLKAYTALHTLARMAVGHTLLVLDGASPFGVLAIQLAHYHGVKVLATAISPDDQKFLEQLRPNIGVLESLVARVIGVWDTKVDLVDSCLEETGGLGVDIVIDAGVRLYEEEPEGKNHFPHKHDIISLLAVGGHWVTPADNLQLDPPDSRTLFLKAASISFLNEEAWEASKARQGRYLHIMKDVVEKLSTGILRPLLEKPVPLYEATVSMEMVQRRQVRKRVVVKL